MKKNHTYIQTFLLLFLFGLPLAAQPVVNGDAVATCYSGGSPTGYVAGIIKVQYSDLQPVNTNWPAPMSHGLGANKFTKQNLGEVFGIAFDNAGNFYLSATTAFSSSNPGGPGGAGGIYKINGITGMISTFASTLNAACGSVTGTGTIPNTGPALGNIAYDLQNNQFFVTNMEDGMIYRLDASGIILSVFDPFAADGCTPGVAPLGERLWGIGVYNNKVYFSRWFEDCGTPSNFVSNEIWSIDLDGAGEFMGSEQLEITIPPLPGVQHSNPVADIAFSAAGNMLLSERTMKAISNDPIFPNAHASRVLEYVLSGIVWVPSANIFSIGVPGPSSGCGSFPSVGANAAGGVDYAYGSFDPATREPLDCDDAVWASGDYLHGWPELIYGLQRLPGAGGLVTGSQLIDLDGNTSSGQKTQIGDIEVFKKCTDQNVPPCEEISYKVNYLPANPDQQDCCIRLEFTNNAANLFTSIGVNMLTAPVTITGALGPFGWGVTNSGTQATWSPLSGTIPVGTIDSLIFCIFSLAAPPQEIEIVYYANDGTVCRDTTRLDCGQQQPPDPVCFSIDTTDLNCAEINASGNTYNYSIQITNNSPFSNAPYFYPAENIFANSITPGVNILPNSMSFAPLAYNATSGWLNFTVSGPAAVPGALVCIELQLHGKKYNEDYQWCCPPEKVCFTLPECKDCCEDFVKEIKLESIKSNANGITSLNLNISAGPAPIMSASATIVSASQKAFGIQNCRPVNWTQVMGYIYNPAASWNGLPLDPNAQPFAYPPPGPYAEASWGIVPSGVSFSNSPVVLNLQFPKPPSSFLCKDSLRFCVRYSFTDTNCVTCDTLICYEQIRKGKIIIGHDDDFEHAVQIGKIIMVDDNIGELMFDLPEPEPGSEPEDEYRITGFKFETEAGVELLSMSDDIGNDIPVIDRVATVKAELSQGQAYTYGLKYSNAAGHKVFNNYVIINYDYPKDASKEVHTSESVLVARAPLPDGSGTDTLDTDNESELPENVRTFALYFSNSNATNDEISRLIIRPKNEARILAVGPYDDPQMLSLSVYSDEGGSLLLAPELSPGAEADVLMPGGTIRPIYLTLSNVDNDQVDLEYETVNSNGDVVSSSEISLSGPLYSFVPDEGGGDTPDVFKHGFELYPAYPNPAASSATIQFSLIRNMKNVSLTVYDMSGRSIAQVLKNTGLSRGEHAVVFNTSGLTDGSYYYTLRIGNESQTHVLNVIR